MTADLKKSKKNSTTTTTAKLDVSGYRQCVVNINLKQTIHL